jgi:hypothetical protein
MENPTPTEIGQKIIDASGVNIYDNTRKRDNVEYRGLLCHLLRNKLHMRWTNIALFMQRKGKAFDHASAIHSVKMYQVYKNYNNQLEELENIFIFKGKLNYDEIDNINYIENKYNSLEEKYEELKVKYALLEKIKIPQIEV